jgi:putative FmdB family regulatory protein
MPLYEFKCARCGAITEVFSRTVLAQVEPPPCPQAGSEHGHEMRRIVSTFVRHQTLKDKIAEAEAKYGKEVDAAMGPAPDVGRYARRYEQLAKDLPPEPD